LHGVSNGFRPPFRLVDRRVYIQCRHRSAAPAIFALAVAHGPFWPKWLIWSRKTQLLPGPGADRVPGRAGIPRVPFPSRNGMPRVVGPNVLTCTAEEVAEAGYDGLMRGRRVVVPGLGNKAVTLLTRLLPRRVFLEAVGHSQMIRVRGVNRILKDPVQTARAKAEGVLQE
jgi:hypothetical protein